MPFPLTKCEQNEPSYGLTPFPCPPKTDGGLQEGAASPFRPLGPFRLKDLCRTAPHHGKLLPHRASHHALGKQV
jgi:hypothetical protein